MNVKRLQKLADFLRIVPREVFNIRGWLYADINEDISSHLHNPERASECGFAACAMGWATQIPSFRRAGLLIAGRTPVFKDELGFDAAEKFFDIDAYTSRYLFHGPSYGLMSFGSSARGNSGVSSSIVKDVTPKMVARRIEQVIAKYEKEKKKQ